MIHDKDSKPLITRSIAVNSSTNYHELMTYAASTVLLIFTMLGIPGCSPAHKHATGTPDRVNCETDFSRLKSLAGDWYLVRGVRLGVKLEANNDEPFINYAVSSGGHSVVEELFVDKPNEMTSVYYLDSGRLMMDHYCSLGNQPRMVAVSGPTNEIPFSLLSVSNMADENDLHISSHSVEFDGPDELTVRWGATQDGEPMGGSFYTVRRADTP